MAEIEVREPWLLPLDDARAVDARLTGNKAANVARARNAGLPTMPGFVVTTAAATRLAARRPAEAPEELVQALRKAWDDLSGGGARPVVVRSSSTIEDAGSTSMAGLFTSVLDVRTWEGFQAAVAKVLGAATHPELGEAPMAVLVQAQLVPEYGGVLFGADPVTGDADRLVVAAVAGGPHDLVGGATSGMTFTLSRRGRLLSTAPGSTPADLRWLTRRRRRRLARLARRTRELFGAPQDVEWAFAEGDRLVLLQSRPITTPLHRPVGPVLGPGPVAETFPAPLAPLEVDLWVDPLRDGLRHAVSIAGIANPKALERSPLVTSVGGWVVADLELLGALPRRRGLAVLDPRPNLRRLNAAWRVGRLRGALTGLGRDLLVEIDRDLAQVPELDGLAEHELAGILRTTQRALVALHGHEVLAGLLLGEQSPTTTGAAVALRALAEGRALGLDDEAIVARDPVVLALVPPAVGPPAPLPPTGLTAPGVGAREPADAVVREALRLRVRWVQELAARAAWDLAVRLARRGVLPEPDAVRLLRLEELEAIVAGAPVPADLSARVLAHPPTVPAAFRLADDGAVLPVDRVGDAVGAGGGRGVGPVRREGEPQPGDVLVVRTLDPALAAVLPRLHGLVAETGSVLSHVAILAREFGVATVVGFANAMDTFVDGEVVLVDGDAGRVERVDAGGVLGSGGDGADRAGRTASGATEGEVR